MTEKKKKLLQYKDFETFGPKPPLFDVSKVKMDKLTLEKRRRHQIYTYLDCMFNHTSYFDFFSKDAFQIAVRSKHFAQLVQKQEVTSEILIFPFLFLNEEITEILEASNITKSTVGNFYSKRNKVYIPSFLEDIKKFLLSLISSPDEIEDDLIPDPSIRFSYEVNSIFEKSAENALERFHTPIITPELLFISLMEEKQTKGGKMIKKLINDETEFYVLRFKLLKRLHYEETTIRNQINPNQLYFGYLLKLYLHMHEFRNALEHESLSYATAYFRYILVTSAFRFNINEFLRKEIERSLSSPRNRRTSYNLSRPPKPQVEIPVETLRGKRVEKFH